MGTSMIEVAQSSPGDEAVYINDNPLDDRTTGICREASEQPPTTLWIWT
jgi:hypothetical protein